MTPCVEHAGYRMPNGYGQVRRQGKTWLAHRWVAHNTLGPCPPGQVVRHKCDNMACVNPDHLEYGTQGDNLNDRKERHRYRKLTRADAEAIRGTVVGSPAEIGRLYGVSSTMVGYIKEGRQWRR